MRRLVLALVLVAAVCGPGARPAGGPSVAASSVALVRPFRDAPNPTSTTTSTTEAPRPTTTEARRPPVTAASRSRATGTDCAGWLDLVASYGDWSVPKACRVLMCESRGDPDARNPSGATGLFQILGGPTDPVANVALAHEMWLDRGWQPWVCQ